MAWPVLTYENWKATGASLHMWSQIVGKLRLANTPWINHSWHAVFYIEPRGFTSSPIPFGERTLQVRFDLFDHQLVIDSSTGETARLTLEDMSVAEFRDRFIVSVEQLGFPVEMSDMPNEVPDPVAFSKQTDPGVYDREQAALFHQAMVRIDTVFKQFRSGFLGKASPVHLFWGSFDLAVTRFSGQTAPRHPGGFPALPDDVTQEAYSHQVSSAGFWMGGGGIDEPAFYCYAYPALDGFADASVEPEAAYYFEPLGEFVLPYAAVQAADEPEAALLAFLQSTYDAAADLGGWDRKQLECEPGVPRRPRPL